ncbi:branched-chain amino acid transport system substrate-binding protein [Bradyrhizobium sp. USDA 4524]|uniref:ABC transporter substrate-binding protein n=1 Tax=unclassified Bradyrhizobium TaxID=2631580 RepID=UPI0035C6879F|nr:branched-chain amino acid transport system substrate-binding protein [Bradyrhizobium sp. USDA 4538]MCP1902381.1 branched-chain amino acid transport system substrate-binding protein [Bradyrhizobium sp. USDA 4537]MCP1991962.1 branched-chain amino acid transport system substrate-binding protein [Bradyrhizobium sp. USDA 4539]
MNFRSIVSSGPARRWPAWRAAATILLAALPFASGARAAEPIKIGLVTALSGQSARAGEALTRGATIAIEEINAKGGVLGRPLELVRRDDESNPAKGLIAARELIQREKVAVLVGGLDTPVELAIVPFVNNVKVPFVVPWAAGTNITRNGAPSNYVFRVSAMDDEVDKAIVQFSRKTYNAKKPGLILVNNPWGESNEHGLKAALKAAGIEPAGVEKFEGNDVDVVSQLSRLKQAGADTLYLVGNVGPSSQVVKSLDRMGWAPPIVSHWGAAGGRFTELAGPSAENVIFVQTYSFFGNLSPVGKRVMSALQAKYSDIKGPADVTPAVGVANAYDSILVIARAIEKAGDTEPTAVRDGFYAIDRVDGLIKTYEKPFAQDKHDALTAGDYIWARFEDNHIMPFARN